ncbi:hypothetical protein NHX12_013416 [Muraenolepis orangiensis]|uniref:Uncharacterized protein n=1 Tax=Muraenolepis orangiensis TaxID=630683 RepID=A0A9Q0DEC0_9TELE|nr:hypothetical protein NHX12_013416 [Muraenolepis orangiensis]
MVTWAGGGGGYCLRALCVPLSAPVADRTGQNETPREAVFAERAPAPPLARLAPCANALRVGGFDWATESSVIQTSSPIGYKEDTLAL